MTVTVAVTVLAVYGNFCKALPCFCLIMHSLKNDLKLECVRIWENVNHAKCKHFATSVPRFALNYTKMSVQ